MLLDCVIVVASDINSEENLGQKIVDFKNKTISECML